MNSERSSVAADTPAATAAAPKQQSKSVQRARALQRITLIGMVLDLLLGGAKILVGLVGHSYGLIADGIHSLTDAFSDVLVLVLANIAGKAPDDDHPYGHGKFETVGTVLMGSLLIGVAGAMAWDSTMRLISGVEFLTPEWPVLVVAGISIVSKEWIYRVTRAVGERYRSDLVIANAWHSRTDALSSIAVLIAAAGAMAGVLWLDVAAALVIAAMVGHIGWRLSWTGLKELVETAVPEESSQAFMDTALAVPGVTGLHFLRARAVGAETTVDVHIQVEPLLSVSEGHHIGILTTRALRQAHSEIADVTCHVDIEGNNAELEQHSSKHQKYLARAQKLPERACIEDAVRSYFSLHCPTLTLDRLQLHYLDSEVSAELLLSHNLPAAHTSQSLTTLREALARELEPLDISRLDLWWREQEQDPGPPQSSEITRPPAASASA